MYQYNKPEDDATKCQKFTPEKRSMVNQVTIKNKKSETPSTANK